jgi:hypothetical protein
MQVEFYKYQGKEMILWWLTTAWNFSKEDRTLVAYATDVWDMEILILWNDPESDFKMVY